MDNQLLSEAESGVQAHLKIIDAKSGSLVKDFPAVDAATYEPSGSVFHAYLEAVPRISPDKPRILTIRSSTFGVSGCASFVSFSRANSEINWHKSKACVSL